jgi:hypothetical protein
MNSNIYDIYINTQIILKENIKEINAEWVSKIKGEREVEFCFLFSIKAVNLNSFFFMF